MSLTGHPDQAPVTLGGHIPLMAVATYVAVATAAALLVRNASGRGLIATVSVRESLESFVEQAMVEIVFLGRSPRGPAAKELSRLSLAHCRAKTDTG